ncbi:rRNA pseudouridine synthase [bacterium]|nr:rRNA pseudouridine synthase [bacterium]RQV95269.1 MAG: rRNA pseudouridine synthase [bacterium]
MQLNKYLADCGVASRRKANLMIQQGRVDVNQEIVMEMGRVIDTEKDCVFLDGHRLKIPDHYRYLLMNKPDGVITAVEDDRGRKTVIDMIPYSERVFPVGRLDMDTEGVLLLTNDGELTYRLTHPKFEIEKVYHVWVKGRVRPKSIQKLKEGVIISDQVMVKGTARIIQQNAEKTLIEMHIHEGKKRQVKRMMKAVGHPVIHLRRIVFAGLTVDDLQSGTCRELTDREVQSLYRQVGLEKN